jgi:hypothetical protein
VRPGPDPRGDGRSRPDEAKPDWQGVYDRATSAQKMRYTELMRTDPVAGMAYLDALAMLEEVGKDVIGDH